MKPQTGLEPLARGSPAPPLGLDIIVPVHGNAGLVRTCVESLLANWIETAGCNARLVLVNDSPGDAEVERLLAEWPPRLAHVEVLVNAQNLGFVRSVNRALSRCASERRDALIVNADTVTFAGTIANLLQAVSQDTKIGFASPRSNNAAFCSLPVVPSVGPVSSAQTHESWLLLSRTLPDWHFSPTAVGFYMWIAHGVLSDVGLLDEAFGSGYEEENDMVMRARRHGWRAVVVNRAFAYHVGSASFGTRPREALLRQRHANHLRLLERHPSFRVMLDRYESAPHFRAERQLTGLLPGVDGRRRIAFDLGDVVASDADALEFCAALFGAFSAAWDARFEPVLICSEHVRSALAQACMTPPRWADPAAPGLHAVAVRIGLPHRPADLLRFEALAPVCLYVMLGADAEDDLPDPDGDDLSLLWDHLAEHAGALAFPGPRSRNHFVARHPEATRRLTWSAALPTQVSPTPDATMEQTGPRSSEYPVLVAGAADAQDACSVAVLEALAKAHPACRFEWLGTAGDAPQAPDGSNCSSPPDVVGRRIEGAAAVVLPSRRAGFGRLVAHALCARRPVVLRRSAVVLDLLDAAGSPDGVWTVATDGDWPVALGSALAWQPIPTAGPSGTTFADWADGLAGLALEALGDDNLFDSLVRRISSADVVALRSGGRTDQRALPPSLDATLATPVPLPDLLAMDGRSFVEHAYATLLRRPADASGLAFYAAQLQKGVTKAEVLRALHESPEGRNQAVALAGLHELLAPPARRSQLGRWWRR